MPEIGHNHNDAIISATNGLPRVRLDESNQSVAPANPQLNRNYHWAPPIVKEAPRHVERRTPVVAAELPPPPSSSQKKKEGSRKTERFRQIAESGGSDSENERRQKGVDTKGDHVRQRGLLRNEPETLAAPTTHYTDGLSADVLEGMEPLRRPGLLKARWQKVKETREANMRKKKDHQRSLIEKLSPNQRRTPIYCMIAINSMNSAQRATQDYLMRTFQWQSSEHQIQEEGELLGSAIDAFVADLAARMLQISTSLSWSRPTAVEFLLSITPGSIRRLEEAGVSFDIGQAVFITHVILDGCVCTNGNFPDAAEMASQIPAFKEGTLKRELKLQKATWEKLQTPAQLKWLRAEREAIEHELEDGGGTFAHHPREDFPGDPILPSNMMISEGLKGVMEEHFEDSLTKYRQDAIHNSLQAFREADPNDETLKAFSLVSQEFICEDGFKVSAILCKYGRPFSIARVSPADVKAMGWYYSKSDMKYWKYERGCDDQMQDFIFKVGIDGDVLDIEVPDLEDGVERLV